MKRLTFEEMAFSRLSDAWCPVTGNSFGPNVPRVVADKILACVGDIPIYHRFDALQGYVRYNNALGCYDRVGSTHVFTDELDATCTRIGAALPSFVRGTVGSGLSQEGNPLEYLSSDTLLLGREIFLVTTLIHGNEPDGVLGTLKAYELLCTHPDFAALRDRFSVVLMPCCNPDGYYNGVRGLSIYGPHPSGVDQPINLNRVWPWFWTEFVPTAGESKGDAPITCSLESQAMYDWLYQFTGSPATIAWALDQHSTAGDGARYVSRDRNFRNLDGEDYEKLWADWNTFRLLRSIQAKRVHNDAMPDLWVNFFRSRWRPHWHSYLGTRCPNDNGGIQAVSFVGEHNKVPDQVITSDLETYQSASNFNFDHIISMALIAQGGVTQRKPAVLVEHEEGINLCSNSQFSSWQPSEYRPGFWSGARIEIGESERSEQHMKGPGKPLRVQPDLTVDLGTGYYDDEGGADLVFSAAGALPIVLAARDDLPGTDGVLAVYSWDGATDPLQLFKGDAGTAAHKQWRISAANTAVVVHMVGSGNLDDPQNAQMIEYALSAGVWTPTIAYTHSTPVVDAAMQRYDPTEDVFIFGGLTAAGTPSPKVFRAPWGPDTFVEVGTDLLGSGDYGMGSCCCNGGSLDGEIALVGTASTAASTLKIRLFRRDTGALNTYAVNYPTDFFEGVANSFLIHCGVVYDGVDTLWIYGGENTDAGVVYSKAASVRWNGTGFDDLVEVTLGAGLTDDGDPEDYAGEEDWIRRFRNWRGLRYFDIETGVTAHFLFGGLERLGDGTDEADVDMKRGFYAHYIDDAMFARPSDYDFAYMRFNTAFPIAGYTTGVTSWSYKTDAVDDGNASVGYIRINNAPGDSVAGELTTRRARTYYLLPPQNRWWREHAALDFKLAKPSFTEDEWRAYIRVYRQGQSVLFDSPMVQSGTLWPSSWMPYGTTRAVETATWADAVDARFFRLQFDWLPSSSFIALTGNEQKLLTIGNAVPNIELWATTTEAANAREYVRGFSAGPTEPKLELRRFSGGEGYDSCALPVYWGGYIKDTAIGHFPSPLQIEIWHHAEYGLGLKVRNGWTEGSVRWPHRFLASGWPAEGTVQIHGGGWWGEPETLVMDAPWKENIVKPDFEQGALLIGDRDPVYGQVSARSAFRYTETFTRSDSTNLGDYWDIISQTGNGWDIRSNQARCEQLGIERWDAYPYARDCAVIAEVSAPNGNKVGLCTRLHWGMGTDLFTHGYVGYLHCTGAATANLVIDRYYYDAGVQTATNLATVPIAYTAGSTITLTLEAVATDITLTASGGATGVAMASDGNHAYPGAFGIYGETTGAGSYVYIDNVSAEVRGGMKTRITE